MKFIAGAPRKGALPAPTTLPPMAALRTLTDDLEALSDKMFQDLEEVNLEVYNKVLKGFKDTGGKCRTFIQEMGALVVAFLAKAEGLEDELAKPDAVAFAEAMEASKTHVLRLIQEVAEAEDIHDRGEARFNKIVASVANEVEKYIRNQGEAQRKKYKTDCLDRIEKRPRSPRRCVFRPDDNRKPDCPPRPLHEHEGGAVARASSHHVGAHAYSGRCSQGVHQVCGISGQARHSSP